MKEIIKRFAIVFLFVSFRNSLNLLFARFVLFQALNLFNSFSPFGASAIASAGKLVLSSRWLAASHVAAAAAFFILSDKPCEACVVLSAFAAVNESE